MLWLIACGGFAGATLAVPVLAKAQLTSRLPILVVDLAHDSVPDEPKARAWMRLVEGGGPGPNTPNGPTAEYEGWVGIERRGQTSQQLFPKIGYGIELRTVAYEDTSAVLLGMPAEEDWVLHGPYSDKSLLRNALAYRIARGVMPYAPRSRFVELVLGGEYRGVYLLTEKIKRDGDRVNLARLEAADTTGVALTGGYLLSVDKGPDVRSGGIGFALEPSGVAEAARRTELRYEYPRADRIAPAQRAYVRAWMQDFEDRLLREGLDDPVDGYLAVVDLRSFVDYCIVNEVAKNIDAYRISTFLYKDREDRGGRLAMGPVWDFNLAFGNADYCGGAESSGWVVNFFDVCPQDAFQAPFWYRRLFASDSFRVALATRYADLRRAGQALSDGRLRLLVDSLEAELAGEPAARNFARWPVLGERVWPNPVVETSHAQAVDRVWGFLRGRLVWLDRVLEGWTSAQPEASPSEPVPIALAPNPGSGTVRLVGLDSLGYPVTLELYAPSGALIGRSVLDGPEVPVQVPPGWPCVAYRLRAPRRPTVRGWWLRSRN